MNNSINGPVAAGYYQHYKGRYYQVLYCARHSETLEWLVIYRALYNDSGFWARPAGMFTENISIAGELVPRFSFTGVTPPDDITN